MTICSVTNLSSPGCSVTSFGYFLVCAFPPSGCVNLVFALWSLIDYRIRLFFHVPTRACVRIFGAPPHNCPCRCLLLRTRFEGKAYQARRHASCVPAGAHLNRVSEAQAGFCLTYLRTCRGHVGVAAIWNGSQLLDVRLLPRGVRGP